MRIVLVDPRGDSRPYDHALGDALVAAGSRVELVTSRFRHGRLPPVKALRVRESFYRLADALPASLPAPLRRLARGLEHPLDLALLVGRLAVTRPDVVHVQWLPLRRVDRLFWRLARRLGLRVVYTAHNAVARDGDAVGRATVAANVRAVDAVVVHSTAGRAQVLAYGAPAAAVSVIPHGALDAYRGLGAVPPGDLPEGAPVVLFAGLIRPYKGLADLLEAWPAVRLRVPAARLLILGAALGREAEPDLERARELEGDGVSLRLGYADADVFAGAFERADVVVLPYRAADQSGVLFTALALGRPLVVTDVGGFRETVEGAGCGVVVPPRDPEALGEAIAALLDDPAERRRLGAAGRAAADGPYSWSRIARRTIDEVYARA